MRVRTAVVAVVAVLTAVGTVGPAVGATLEAGTQAADCQGRTTVPSELDIGEATVGETTKASYTFKNPSDQTIQFSSKIKGPDADAFAIVDGGGGSVGGGECVTVTIAFTPQEARDYDAIIVATAADEKASTALDGQGVEKTEPKIALTPSEGNFGNVTVGNTANKTFVIENTGDAPLALDGVDLAQSGGRSPFVIKGGVPDVLGPGETARISVAFSPSSAGTFETSLTVQSNATNTNDGSASAALRGQGIEPGELTTSKASLNFGNVSVGESKQLSFTLTNDGGQPVSLAELSVEGSDAFTIVEAPDEVPAGSSATVTVEYEPDGSGSDSGLLKIRTADGSVPGLDVSLSGSATAPSLKVAPSSVNFGETKTSETVEKRIRIINRGNEPLKITSLNIRGQNPAKFSIQGVSLPLTVPAGSTTAVTVVFSSASQGSFSASLIVGSNAPGPDKTVYLSNTITTVQQESEQTEEATQTDVKVNDARNNSTLTFTFGGDGNGSSLWYSGAAGKQAAMGNVSLTTMNLTIEKGGDFQLGVASSEQKLGSTPKFYLQPRNGTEPVGYLNVSHTISDENIKEVEFLHRVSKQRLKELDADIEDYALYRYVDGEWVELNTTVVREAPSYYVVRATSPGLSDFTSGVKQPKFRLVTATVTVTKINIGDDVGVRVKIRNDGGADGTYNAKLLLEGEIVAQKAATIGAKGKRVITFQQEITKAGEYTVKVNNVTVDNVSVTKKDVEGTAESTPAGQTEATEQTSTPGFGLVVALVALVAAALLARRRD